MVEPRVEGVQESKLYSGCLRSRRWVVVSAVVEVLPVVEVVVIPGVPYQTRNPVIENW